MKRLPKNKPEKKTRGKKSVTGIRAKTKSKPQPNAQITNAKPKIPDTIKHRLITIAFFAFIFWWVWQKISTDLLYHGFGVFADYPLFMLDWEFLSNTAAYPGGISRIINGFCSQLFYYPLMGAVVITAMTGLMFLTARSLFGISNKDWTAGLAYLPAFTMLMTYRLYDHPLVVYIAVLLCLVLARLFICIPYKNLPLHCMAFCIFYLGAFWIAGGNAVVFLLVICIVMLKQKTARIAPVVLILIATAIQTITGMYLLGMDWGECFNILTAYDHQITPAWFTTSINLTLCITFFVPAVLALQLLKAIIRKQHNGNKTKPNLAKDPQKKKPTLPFVVLHPILLAGVLCLALLLSQTDKKGMLEIHALARLEQWDAIIQKGLELRRQGAVSEIARFEVNRALYHTGQMGDRFFSFHQETLPLVFHGVDISDQTQFDKKREIRYDLGDVNAAEHWAYETLEVQGPCPFILYELAKFHIIKKRPELARVFLNKLKKDIIWNKKAASFLDKLDKDPLMQNDKEISAKRKQLMQTNYAMRDMTARDYLNMLFDNNPSNRMAFEYLMSAYMLAHDRESVIENFGRLKDLGFDRLPRHYAEAAAIHSAITKKPIDLKGWKMESAVINQQKRIMAELKAVNNNKKAAFPILAPRFGDSYFFYSLYNTSGINP